MGELPLLSEGRHSPVLQSATDSEPQREEGRNTSPSDNSFVRYCRRQERLQQTNRKQQRMW